MILPLEALVMTLICLPVAAKTVYIAPTGDDARSGLTPADAMATLKNAQWRAAAGDTIEIAGCRYPWVEGTWINVAGTAKVRITIQAAIVNGKPQVVTITGTGTAQPNNYCIGTGSEWIDIRGITCENFAEIGLLIHGGHDIHLVANTFRRLGNTGIAVYSDRDGRRQAYNIIASGNIITDTNRRWAGTRGVAGWGQGISLFADNSVLRFNHISQTRGEGIGIAGVGNQAIGNYIRDSCSVGLYLDTTSNSIAERNFVIQGVSAASKAFFSTCQIADYNNQPLFGNGIQIASETDTYTAKPQQRLVGNVIRNNIVVNARVGLFYGSYGYAAGGGDGMRDTLIVNNIFVGNRENAITLQAGLRSPHSNNIIANNLFYWSGVLAPWVVSVDAGGGFGFLHNLWFGPVPGAAAGAGDVLADPRLANPGGTAPSAFIPETTSPARGAANPAFRPPNDFSGTVRPAPGDIGAFVIP